MTEKEILEYYGGKHQVIVAMEELAELIQQLSKSVRGSDNRIEIVEEIADVQIMLEQMRIFFNISTAEIYDVMRLKLERETERINERINSM